MMKLTEPKAANVKRSPSEATTLVCAVSLAVALGVACGAWINARLASAASKSSAAVNRLRPAERAAVRNAPGPPAVVEPTQVEPHEAFAAHVEASPSDEPPEAEPPRADADAAADKVSADRAGKARRGGPAPLEAEASPRERASVTRG